MTTATEQRLARLEGAYEQINIHLGRVESRIEQSFDQLRQETRAGFDRLDGRIDRVFYSLMAGIAVAIRTTILTRIL